MSRGLGDVYKRQLPKGEIWATWVMQRVGEDLRTHLPSGLASVWIQNSNTVTCGELCTLSPCPSAPHPWAMSQKNAPKRPRECVRDDVHHTTARHTGGWKPPWYSSAGTCLYKRGVFLLRNICSSYRKQTCHRYRNLDFKIIMMSE